MPPGVDDVPDPVDDGDVPLLVAGDQVPGVEPAPAKASAVASGFSQ